MIRCEALPPTVTRPHVVLLGAGASKAALPEGDRYGNPVPLLRDVATALGLDHFFPEDLRALASSDFEAAYSELCIRNDPSRLEIERQIVSFFEELELPDEPNMYDILQLCLRDKDLICTFNWDPFLVQSRLRLLTVDSALDNSLPQLVFLHGNVAVGFCGNDRKSGPKGQTCNECGELFQPSPLLFPVQTKNYQDSSLIEREWEAVNHYFQYACMLSIFGYRAPETDVEAVRLRNHSPVRFAVCRHGGE